MRLSGSEMNPIVFALYILNLALIGVLPRLFFKRGEFNVMWWLTASPFLLCSLVLIASFFGLLHPYKLQSSVFLWISGALSVGSMLLIVTTIRTHKTPLALWHQEAPPESIVMHGPYRYIRHPFYSSFLMTLFGAVLLCPHPGTVGCFLYAAFLLNWTAAKEERFLSDSAFGDQYRIYRQRTGRFLPKFLPAAEREQT